VEGDPVNRIDPAGLDWVQVDSFLGGQIVCLSYYHPERGKILNCSGRPRVDVFELKGAEAKTIEEAGIGWLQHHERENQELVSQLANALSSLPDACVKAFKDAGIDVGGLRSSARGIHYFSSNRRGERSLGIGHVVGPNAVNGSRPIFAAGMIGSSQPNATVLQQWIGTSATNTHFVVLHAGFYNQSSAAQDATLVHEALHVCTGGADGALATSLGLSGGNPGAAIQTVIERQCDR
jgi:hypothetical protein